MGMERVVVSLGWDGGRRHVGELNTEFNQHCLFNSESLWWSSERGIIKNCQSDFEAVMFVSAVC